MNYCDLFIEIYYKIINGDAKETEWNTGIANSLPLPPKLLQQTTV